MRYGKFILPTVLLAALPLQAAYVSKPAAMTVAGAWSRSNEKLGARIGADVSSATEFTAPGGGSYYAVKMASGGTVFVASDDRITPVIAFTSAGDPDLSENSPLKFLLDKDIEARTKIAGLESGGASKTRATWLMLARPAVQTAGKTLGTQPSIPAVTGISDLRVAPLVKSQWSQMEANGKYCYNYYTPNHDPCGCTATAAAQIMRYHKYPDTELPARTYDVTVSGEATTLDTIGESRLYDWDSMTLIPKNGVSDESREAIGRLTYDIAIALNSDFTPSFTGALPENLCRLFVNEFGYASGCLFFDENGWDSFYASGRRVSPTSGLHTREVRNKIIYTNLDSGHPVEFGLYSYTSGHAVVADGYGFVTINGEETEYVHINMGWAGVDDVWYNIPEINAANSGSSAGDSTMDFIFLSAAAYNVFPKETGAILSGRVISDDEGEQGAVVTVYDRQGEVAAEAVSGEHGIYAFILPKGTYSVKAVSADGARMDYLEDIELQTPVADGIDPDDPKPNYITNPDNIGNSWGNDLDLTLPSVRIGEELFTRLDTALAAVADMETENPLVEIINPTTMRSPVTLFDDVTIVATNAAPGESPIAIKDTAFTSSRWAIQVGEGATVSFSNVVFEAEQPSDRPAIDVQEGAEVRLSGILGLGTVYLADEYGFVLQAPVEPTGCGVGVSPRWKAVKGSVFGSYECSSDDAAATAPLFACMSDPTLACLADADGSLYFDRAEIDPSVAYVYATDGATTAFYRSIDMLLEDYPSDVKIVLLRDCPVEVLTNSATLATNETVRSRDVAIESGDDGPYSLSLKKGVGFTVGDGTALSLKGVSLMGDGQLISSPLVTVSGGKFEMLEGTSISGLPLSSAAAPVWATSGEVVMESGSSITNCTAVRSASGKAGAIYLAGKNTSFSMKGGTITSCTAAADDGGAVYAGSGATVLLSGDAAVKDNFTGAKKGVLKRSNLYMTSSADPLLTVAGGLTGYVGVTYSGRDAAGKKFAAIMSGLPDNDVQTSLLSFFSDKNASLVAVKSASGGTLEWAVDNSFPKQVPESAAQARISDSEGERFYAYVGDAFCTATNGAATITLVTDAELTNSLSVASPVVFDGAGFTLGRTGSWLIAVTNASLNVTNLTIYGRGGSGRMIDVYKSGLTLEAGATVEEVFGWDQSMVAPIVVWGGTFTMNPGSSVHDCWNSYMPDSGGSLAAGAVVVSGATDSEAVAHLYGGAVTRCIGTRAGGVYIGNKAAVDVKGDAVVRDNVCAKDASSLNLVVQDKSALTLVDDLEGRIYYTEGILGSDEVFGRIDETYAASAGPSNLVASARRFRHDATGAKGMPVRNSSAALLVWSDAIDDEDDTYISPIDGAEYEVVRFEMDDDEDDPVVVECEPFTFTKIECVDREQGKWRLVLQPGVKYCKYTLYVSDDLETWTQSGETKTLSDEDLTGELEFEFEATATGEKRFWSVRGQDGTK